MPARHTARRAREPHRRARCPAAVARRLRGQRETGGSRRRGPTPQPCELCPGPDKRPACWGCARNALASSASCWQRRARRAAAIGTVAVAGASAYPSVGLAGHRLRLARVLGVSWEEGRGPVWLACAAGWRRHRRPPRTRRGCRRSVVACCHVVAERGRASGPANGCQPSPSDTPATHTRARAHTHIHTHTYTHTHTPAAGAASLLVSLNGVHTCSPPVSTPRVSSWLANVPAKSPGHVLHSRGRMRGNEASYHEAPGEGVGGTCGDACAWKRRREAGRSLPASAAK
jgi:hypothetical protein